MMNIDQKKYLRSLFFRRERMNEQVSQARQQAFEECAELVENYSPDLNSSGSGGSVQEIAAAIRKLGGIA